LLRSSLLVAIAVTATVQAGWTVTAHSQETTGEQGQGARAIDGNSATMLCLSPGNQRRSDRTNNTAYRATQS
jgi:hypothetical protein